ncbi:MAG: hypothetical protein A3D40_00910 [Parcubacteria group bacterium RIFCSPHIGHO2_02_FULL_40_12]|nr:MAG: hypothetical protein A3D40_00910 [Parcubacteria group bacterium RIFCSPHIGHO2_02_FULL_40_12]
MAGLSRTVLLTSEFLTSFKAKAHKLHSNLGIASENQASNFKAQFSNVLSCNTFSKKGLGCSPFTRRYLGNGFGFRRICFLFLRLLRCFTSAGLHPLK